MRRSGQSSGSIRYVDFPVFQDDIVLRRETLVMPYARPYEGRVLSIYKKPAPRRQSAEQERRCSSIAALTVHEAYQYIS